MGPAMADANEFFNLQSLASFGGATLATCVIPNALRVASSNRLKASWIGLIGFVVAQTICLVTVYSAPDPEGTRTLLSYLVAFANGCLVFTSAAGSTAGLISVTGNQNASTDIV